MSDSDDSSDYDEYDPTNLNVSGSNLTQLPRLPADLTILNCSN